MLGEHDIKVKISMGCIINIIIAHIFTDIPVNPKKHLIYAMSFKTRTLNQRESNGFSR